jgi:tetratricopeptide (TPR) repeat protein
MGLLQENTMLGAIGWKIPKDMESGTRLQGYTDQPSYKHGMKLNIHAATKTPGGESCKIRILRMGWYGGMGARQVATFENLIARHAEIWDPSKNQNEAFISDSCKWPILYSLNIPNEWHSGLYLVRLELEDNSAYLHPFYISDSKVSGITLVCSTVTNQARNWWGGASATHSVSGKPKKNRDLYFPSASEELTFQRPMYNPRGGDSLRWDYPLIRFLERNKVEVSYVSDCDLNEDFSKQSVPETILTTGPARYWTIEAQKWIEEMVRSGSSYIHLGSEAGQHIVELNDDTDNKIIKVHPHKYDGFYGERRKNPFTLAQISGSRPQPPWGNLILKSGETLEGVLGSSWDLNYDPTTANCEILGTGKGKHRFFRNRRADFFKINTNGGGTVFNLGCSNWTWALSAFGKQGNVRVSTVAQKLTWSILGLSEKDLNLSEDNEELHHDITPNKNQSIEELNSILRENPEDNNALLLAAIKLFDENRFNDSLTYLERAISIEPNMIQAKYYFGRCLYKLKRYQELLPVYQELLKLRPDRYHYVIQYAQILIELKLYREAEEVLNGALRMRRNDPRGYMMLGFSARREKNFNKAESYLRKALKIDNNHKQTMVNLATVLQEKFKVYEAKVHWEKVLEMEPSHYSGLMGMARAEMKLGDYEAAEDYLRQITDNPIHEHRYWPYVELLNLLYNHKQSYHEVIKYSKQAQNKAREAIMGQLYLNHIPVVHECLAYMANGDLEKALKTAENQTQGNSSNDELNLLLSCIHRALGNNQTSWDFFVKVFHELELINPITSTHNDLNYSVDYLGFSNPSKERNPGPLVSIIMTAYKAEDLIINAVKSILHQSWTNLDLIIVDDCSPDNTFELLEELAQLDSRIQIFRMKKNGGTYVAKNYGLKHAKGEYVTFHDSDDWLHPEKIRKQIEFLEASGNEILGCTTGYIRIDEKGIIHFRGKGAIRHACISLMIRRQVVENVGFFDSVRVSADSEYERRIMTIYGKNALHHMEMPLLIASVRSESLSQGGKFALEWNGITGARMEYRSAFEAWHEKLRTTNASGFMPRKPESRPFPAPKEMIW